MNARAGERGENMAATLSGSLADIVLPDTDEHHVRLGSLWENGPAVIVFLRHYG